MYDDEWWRMEIIEIGYFSDLGELKVYDIMWSVYF